MSTLSEAYGNNYAKETTDGRLNHIINLISKNLSVRNFGFKLNSRVIWNGCNISPTVKHNIYNTMKTFKQFIFGFIDKSDKAQLKMLPFLVNGPVEYFYIMDLEKGELYFLYITTDQVEVVCSSKEVDGNIQ